MHIAILGRQHKISLAELEAKFGSAAITPLGKEAALVNVEDISQTELGGTIKVAKHLATIENTDVNGAFSYLKATIPEHLKILPEGKLQFGLSVYGFDIKPRQILQKMLELKKTIRLHGRSVRIIENKSTALSSAQVLYNKLTSELGWELLLIKDGSNVVLGQTIATQDINEYSKRDFERPARDAKVGMLPPKLAQIMINLAHPNAGSLIYDPFCGTGVVLQEAHLLGHEIAGSDLEPRMIEYTKENLIYLDEKLKETKLSVDDAQKVKLPENIGAVVCEMYLGQPLHKPPANTHLDELLEENYQLLTNTLENFAPQLESGTPLCLAIPAWRQTSGTTSVLSKMLTIDHLEKFGYTSQKFSLASPEDLIYAREDQIVGRQLLVLRRD